jgi:hypothetical protein
VPDILPLKQLIDDPLQVEEIHVLGLSPVQAERKEIDGKVLPVAVRSLGFMSNEVLLNDLKIAKLYIDLLRNCPAEAVAGKREIALYECFPEFLIATRPIFAPRISSKASIMAGRSHQGRFKATNFWAGTKGGSANFPMPDVQPLAMASLSTAIALGRATLSSSPSWTCFPSTTMPQV